LLPWVTATASDVTSSNSLIAKYSYIEHRGWTQETSELLWINFTLLFKPYDHSVIIHSLKIYVTIIIITTTQILWFVLGSRDSWGDIATDHGLDGRVSIPCRGITLSTPWRPDRFWGPANLLFGRYREQFHRQ
jgi:hypothetical protein